MSPPQECQERGPNPSYRLGFQQHAAGTAQIQQGAQQDGQPSRQGFTCRQQPTKAAFPSSSSPSGLPSPGGPPMGCIAPSGETTALKCDPVSYTALTLHPACATSSACTLPELAALIRGTRTPPPRAPAPLAGCGIEERRQGGSTYAPPLSTTAQCPILQAHPFAPQSSQ